MRSLHDYADLAFTEILRSFLPRLKKKILKIAYASKKLSNMDDLIYIEVLYIIVLRDY